MKTASQGELRFARHPSIGDRKHPLIARCIFTEYPFRPFSGSYPYSGTQQLRFSTSRAPEEANRAHLRSRRGFRCAETANEFASLRDRCIAYVGMDGVQTEHRNDVVRRTEVECATVLLAGTGRGEHRAGELYHSLKFLRVYWGRGPSAGRGRGRRCRGRGGLFPQPL